MLKMTFDDVNHNNLIKCDVPTIYSRRLEGIELGD
jgi:hypothetical protein